ncbi:glyceraldehyde-3-phosphate dehydrogenase-like [Sitophilus oryzae]|uniref:Glyceraldehyde-3-phosphate dehydrogenase n=1 Tax=Sitophilus oryzae TaxID=7048 RepID=A0A6J2Y8W9_SITOR|nr:glyceraldehyde-3-phosphate dehydrogenase-like [Sitophilus oryzae]
MAKVGINGFGRTGRLLLRAMIQRVPDKVVPSGINNPESDSAEYIAYIFKHDSTHGRFYGEVCYDEKHLIVNKIKIPIFKETDAKNIPWDKAGVEYVAECSGRYTTVENAKSFLKGSVKKVVISASSSDAPMYVLGVNNTSYNPKDKVVSMASCTTNCLAPLAKVVHDKFGIREGLMTTVHSATENQHILDGFSINSWRDSRAAISNIIPASTGVAKAIGKVIPDLNGKLTGMAFRVPTPTVSVVDLTARICKAAKLSEINEEIKNASKYSLSGILCYTEEKVVSTDFIGCSCSSIYDATASIQLNENFVKLISWYDNEYGYASRLAEFLAFIHEKDQEAACAEKKQPKCN